MPKLKEILSQRDAHTLAGSQVTVDLLEDETLELTLADIISIAQILGEPTEKIVGILITNLLLHTRKQ